jgi:dimethylhistidine N-methyltransferase
MRSALSSFTALPARLTHEQRIFLRDCLAGLRESPKRLPCKYFYDSRGSELFDRICQLEEYYLTRAELAIMDQFAPPMGERLGPGVMLVEFGSGSSVKTRYLLDALAEPIAYVPIDVSGEHLQATARELARDYPHIEILPLCADFTKTIELPRPKQAARSIAVYFPGSTIGNFLPVQATKLLHHIAACSGRRGSLLIGIDLQKDRSRMEAAYNDPLGVTAEFNLNLLRRMNRELGADFELSRFAHQARYDNVAARIEMVLISRQAQTVTIGDQALELVAGEEICTEYSHKYTVEQFAAMAAGPGFVLRERWTDANGDFAVLHFEVA